MSGSTSPCHRTMAPAAWAPVHMETCPWAGGAGCRYWDMSVGQFPASAADSLVQGYCDELLMLATSLAETLTQVRSRSINIAASQAGLGSALEGMASLTAIINEVQQGEPTAAAKPAKADEPEPFGSVARTGNEIAWETPASAPKPMAEDVPGDLGFPESMSEEFPELKSVGSNSAEPKVTGPEFTGSEFSEPEFSESEFTESKFAEPESEFDDVDAEFLEAYSFLSDPGLSGPPRDSQPEEEEPVDPNAPVHFDKRPSAGLARALNSLSPLEATSVAKKPLGKGEEASGEEVATGTRVNPSLKGTSATIPLRSVFQFIERVRKSGVMRVDLDDEVLTFEFEAGLVLACRTSNQGKGDRLGDLLADVEDARELRALLTQGETMNNLQIGELVVRSGLVTNGQVMNALETQVHGRFRRACDAQLACYEFIEGTIAAGDGRIRIAPMELTFESRR